MKLEDARRRNQRGARRKPREIGQPMNIASGLTEGGNIVAHVRMDNAWIAALIFL